MSGEKQAIASLQKFADGFALDVGRVRAALADESTSAAAQLVLVGGLNYVLDALDIFPDHYQGLGLVDDALVLRLSAMAALECGAQHRGLRQLAGDELEVRALVGELFGPLAKLVAQLAERSVKNRTPAQILKDPDVRAVFESDLTRLLKRHQTAKIEPIPGGDEAVVEELRRMIATALRREKLV